MIMDEVGTEGGWALMTVQMEIGGVAVRMSRLLMTGTMIAGGKQQLVGVDSELWVL